MMVVLLGQKRVVSVAGICAILILIIFTVINIDSIYESFYIYSLSRIPVPCELTSDQKSYIVELGRMRSKKSIPTMLILMRECSCSDDVADPFESPFVVHHDCIKDALIAIGPPAGQKLMESISLMSITEQYDLSAATMIARIFEEDSNIIILSFIEITPTLERIMNNINEEAGLRTAARNLLGRIKTEMLIAPSIPH